MFCLIHLIRSTRVVSQIPMGDASIPCASRQSWKFATQLESDRACSTRALPAPPPDVSQGIQMAGAWIHNFQGRCGEGLTSSSDSVTLCTRGPEVFWLCLKMGRIIQAKIGNNQKTTAPFKEGFLNTRSSTFIALGVRAVRVNITAWCKRCINKHGNYKLNYNPSIQRNAPVKPVAVGCFWTAVAVVENPGQAHTAASSTGALGRSSSAPKSKSSRISWRRTEPRQLARKFTEKKETVTRLYFHEWSTKWSTKRAMFHGSQRSTCT